MSLIGQKADIMLEALQAMMCFLVIEQALQFFFRGRFALLLLPRCMSPNDTNARPAEYNFSLGNLNLAIVQVQVNEMRLKKCRGFGGGGNAGIGPAAARRPIGCRNRHGENRQVRRCRLDGEQNTLSIHDAPIAVASRFLGFGFRRKWNREDWLSVHQVEMHSGLRGTPRAARRPDVHTTHRVYPRMNGKGSMQVRDQILIEQR
jgi:hypothetical protein